MTRWASCRASLTTPPVGGVWGGHYSCTGRTIDCRSFGNMFPIYGRNSRMNPTRERGIAAITRLTRDLRGLWSPRTRDTSTPHAGMCAGGNPSASNVAKVLDGSSSCRIVASICRGPDVALEGTRQLTCRNTWCIVTGAANTRRFRMGRQSTQA
uniref:Uncharacterized protein n=1 Tax=Magnusiomyces tetraspermus TaxID=1232584 RepID=A0A023UNG8_9ASCO|nr:hypothetical protein [Magnusiomyces tetraspermus]AHY04923.1 hypothetical protein [Magnusiomyces tetraspermus]